VLLSPQELNDCRMLGVTPIEFNDSWKGCGMGLNLKRSNRDYICRRLRRRVWRGLTEFVDFMHDLDSSAQGSDTEVRLEC
jgi:hypothetical protein